MKKIILIFLSIFLISGCYTGSDKKQDFADKKKHESAKYFLSEINEIQNNKKTALVSFVDSLSIEEKVSQLFIANLAGDTEFVPVEYMDSLIDNNFQKIDKKGLIPGGYLFFGYNIRNDIEGTMYFTDKIRNYCIDNDIIPPFLAVDQEGGFVNRLRTLNGPLPSEERVSDCLDVSSSYKLYSLQAVQMSCLGFNMNLSPVVEVLTSENSQFLNGRSFGNAENVLKYGKACVNAYENNKIGTVLKHFPGNTNTDPHTGLPEINLSESELFASLEPFKKLVKTNPSGVLMSHARTKSFDSKNPACLSSFWVTEKLRNEFGFEGVIFSDDIFMGALADNGFPQEKAVLMAINAGIDVIMFSEKRFARTARLLIQEAENNPDFMKKINEAVYRIISYKIKAGLLEFKRYEAGKNDYKIVISENFSSVEDRIVYFNDARDENIKLYRAYF